jgi:hypothetical protein
MQPTTETQAPRLEPSSDNNMVWIPSGTFLMGSDRHYAEEAPAYKETVEGFWMDKFTVTNEQFVRFVEATGHILRGAASSRRRRTSGRYVNEPRSPWRKSSVATRIAIGEFCEPLSSCHFSDIPSSVGSRIVFSSPAESSHSLGSCNQLQAICP